MTTQPTPIRDVAQLVADLLDVQQQLDDLTDRAAGIKAQLADCVGVGNAAEVGDVIVSVREPSRRFNLDRAWALLSDEQRGLCYDRSAAKVKKQLAPVLLDQCMEPGTGSPIVSVK